MQKLDYGIEESAESSNSDPLGIQRQSFLKLTDVKNEIFSLHKNRNSLIQASIFPDSQLWQPSSKNETARIFCIR
ncbi:MAG: hypothetical protein ACRCWB_06130 [Enterovibrio sp.]